MFHGSEINTENWTIIASIIQLADIYTQVNTGQDFVLYLGII
jgi:hypothetical protein